MHQRTSSRTEAEKCFAQVDAALTVLTNTRPLEAATVRAARAAVLGRSQESSRILVDMLKNAAPGFAGWAIPVDPLFRNLLQDESFRAVEELLAARAD
jgi:hypothetical protein